MDQSGKIQYFIYYTDWSKRDSNPDIYIQNLNYLHWNANILNGKTGFLKSIYSRL